MKKNRKILKQILATLIVMTMLPSVTTVANTKNEKKQNIETRKEYVVFNDELDSKKIRKKSLTNMEVEEFKQENEDIIIEKNIKFKASWNENYVDPEAVSDDWNLNMINVNDSGDEIVAEDKIKIAIIDSGIDVCDGISVKERYNLVPSEENVNPIFDDITGHGTAIASIICGTKDADRKSYGINNNVEIYSIKIMDGDNTAPLDRVVEAIYKAIECDVDIINMSFGTTQNSKILQQAVEAAYSEGILMVAAAGNRGEEDGVVEFPAAYDEVMAVGSVDANAQISVTSSNGDEVDVYAPGDYVKTATSFGLETVSSGTSIATPHVVGLASILWQRDRSKSVDYIKQLIIDSSKEIESNNKKIKLIDIGYAVDKYDDFEKTYKNNKKIKKNTSDTITCEETAEVSARWSKNKHGTLVINNANGKLTEAQVKMVRAGIRYNDEILPGSTNSSAGIKYERRVWHSLTYSVNYMAVINYIGRIIRNTDCSTNITYNDVTNFTSAYRTRINTDINAIKKPDLLQIGLHGDKDSSEYKNLDFDYRMRRLLILGMELHVITDAFAHRAYGISPYLAGNDPSHWIKISTEDTDGDGVNDLLADDITRYPSRYEAAGRVVRNVMNQCLVFNDNDVVQMKKTKLILSKQIMYNNPFSSLSNTEFNDRFLLYKLYSYASANSAYDNTFSTYSNAMAGVSYEW